MLSSGQIWSSKHSLEMSKTLARFRDPTWCSHVQLIGRMRLHLQCWSPGEHQSILGTLFANTDFKCWNVINSVFTQFNLPNPFKWTLVLLVCSHSWHGGLTNGRTWTLDGFWWGNKRIFTNIYETHHVKSWNFTDFDDYVETIMFQLHQNASVCCCGVWEGVRHILGHYYIVKTMNSR